MSLRKQRANIWSVLVAAILLFLLASGCGDDQGLNSGNGSIFGYVYRAGSNWSVDGVRVSCAGTSTTTSAKGYYELSNLPTGWRTLTASGEDFELFSTEVYVTRRTVQNIYMTPAGGGKGGIDE